MGATVIKLARILRVNPDTIYEWQNKYPEFSESIQRGRDYFDSELVEHALFKRAIGFKYKVKTYTVLPSRELVLSKYTKKYMPPSVNAIRFWLSNRNPERWNLKTKQRESKPKFYTSKDIQKMLDEEKERYPQLIKS